MTNEPRVQHDLPTYELGGGPLTLLLVHPLGADGAFWQEVQGLLADRYRTIAYDRRGSGQSPAPTRPWTLDDHARDLDVLCDSLGLEAVVPIGVAAGAMVAARFSASHPHRVRGLILSNPMLAMTDAANEVLAARGRKGREEGMAALAEDVIAAAFQGLDQQSRREFYRQRFVLNDPVAYELTHLGMQSASILDDLRRIKVPTAVVSGVHDPMVTLEMAREAASLLSDSYFQEIPEASHLPPVQNPEGFVRAVEPLLRSLG